MKWQTSPYPVPLHFHAQRRPSSHPAKMLLHNRIPALLEKSVVVWLDRRAKAIRPRSSKTAREIDRRRAISHPETSRGCRISAEHWQFSLDTELSLGRLMPKS